MKKCPNCQKEFPDTMRFCQADGTPLVEVAEESQPEDPLKTTVVRQEDIASSIPQEDPYKTMVASSGTREESGDLLDLPQENFDPLKTMVAKPIGKEEDPILEEPKPETPKFDEIKEEIKPEAPLSGFSGFSQPNEPLPEPPKDLSSIPTEVQPEPPKFNEPSVNPPTFGDSSAKKEEDDLPATVMQNPWDAGNAPKSDESPFAKPSDAPVSSPFDAPKFDEPKTPFGQPSSPFEQPKSSFEAPKESSFEQPQSFNQPQSFEPPKPTFEEPSNQQFGQQQFDQMNQGFGNQPLQASEWTPPPSPEQSWGEQGVGSNTPFQPPAAGGGQNQTLAIISLVTGILSLLCCAWFLPGIAAVVLGFMARSKAQQNPNEYGGSGLALGGIITGGISIVLGILVTILYFMGAIATSF